MDLIETLAKAQVVAAQQREVEGQIVAKRVLSNATRHEPMGLEETLVTVDFTDFNHKDDYTRWYVLDERNEAKLVPGLLSKHLQERHPSMTLGGAVHVYRNGVYCELTESAAAKVVMDHIYTSKVRTSQIKDVLNLWQIVTNTVPDSVNDSPMLINLKNGIYDIKTKNLKYHNPSFKSTQQIRASYVPGATIVRFAQYLDEVLPKDSQILAQEIMGYIISGLNRAKKAFILMGISNSGKSVLINLVEMLIGEDNCSHVPWQNLSERFNVALLYGKLLNSFADLPATALKDTGVFKTLTGGSDRMMAERKGKDAFKFTNRARFLFSCNKLPRIYGDQTAIDRLVILKFSTTIPEEKRIDLMPVFEKELDGILLWALEGLHRLINNNFVFSNASDSISITEDYKKSCSPVLVFIDEMCVIESNASCKTSELHATYSRWCEINGFHRMSIRAFIDELESNFELDRYKHPKTRQSHLIGIGLVAGTEFDDFI